MRMCGIFFAIFGRIDCTISAFKVKKTTFFVLFIPGLFDFELSKLKFFALWHFEELIFTVENCVKNLGGKKTKKMLNFHS